jgi:hypothetical protein
MIIEWLAAFTGIPHRFSRLLLNPSGILLKPIGLLAGLTGILYKPTGILSALKSIPDVLRSILAGFAGLPAGLKSLLVKRSCLKNDGAKQNRILPFKAAKSE